MAELIVEVANCNCPWCLNTTLARLRERAAVRSTHANVAAGCVLIEHDDDPAELLAQIGRDLRAVEIATNGEAVMDFVAAREEPTCRLLDHGPRRMQDLQRRPGIPDPR